MFWTRFANPNLCDDPEITFKQTNTVTKVGTVRNRDSSSSEEGVNTSDELMIVDINEQFITDCQEEA